MKIMTLKGDRPFIDLFNCVYFSPPAFFRNSGLLSWSSLVHVLR